MFDALSCIAIFLGTVAGMEGVAWGTHKYVMHGVLWPFHKSHHSSSEPGFKPNDVVGLFFVAISVSLLFTGWKLWSPVFFVGLGIFVYVVIFLFIHDILVHQRFGIQVHPRGRYLLKMYTAHRLHHAVSDKNGAVSFGFLIAPSTTVLKEQLRMNRARGANVDEHAVETSHEWVPH